MMTPKELFLAMVKGEKTDRLINGYEYLDLIFSDPLMNQEQRKYPGESVCPWGVHFMWPEGDYAATPLINDKTKVCPDIEEWRDYVHAPSLDVPESAWDDAKAQVAACKADGSRLSTLWCHTGLFERFHFLMGFEDALCNLLTCPDESRELVEYVTDWRIDFLTRCFDHLDVDAVFFHDDWGSKNSTFFSPDTFREIFKPSYQRLYGFIKDSGKLLIHHADSYCATLVDDMIDLGINCWQGVLPSNDLPALQKKYNGKIIFQGGFDSGVVDRNDSTEAEIRAHVDEVFRQSARLGAWIPSITNGDPGCIHENAYHIIVDECAKQIELYKTV
jgi:hypothetical protein